MSVAIPPERPCPVDKIALLAQLRARAEAELETVSDAQRAAALAATHEESKPENDKDTRAIESSYLARGQAARVADLREAVALLAALKLESVDAGPARGGSLVEFEEDDRAELCFLVPAGAGKDVELPGKRVRTVSTRSPLGRAFLGRRVDDELEVPTPHGPRNLRILAIW
jgi:transcription elongation GreA/GreB family factor